MDNKFKTIATIILGVLLILIAFIWNEIDNNSRNNINFKSVDVHAKLNNNSTIENINQAQQNTNATPSNSNTELSNINTALANSSTTPATTNVAKPASAIAYPMDNMPERPTDNPFGTFYPPGGEDHPDLIVCPTAKYYSGYHTGLDLEATSAEQTTAVPVYAIADGKVRQAGPVTGYGTLIVLEFTVSDATYTAYYGHVDSKTVTVKAGELVSKGEKIAELGTDCSSANGNVRKHLHFGLHKGTSINVRGYAPNQATLNNWLDPKTFFIDQGLT